MKKTVWSIFRDLVNSKEVGTEITRQEILDEVERQLIEDGTFIETKGVKRARFSAVTLDCSRNMATGRYYLEKTERVGHYKIICHFPPDYTVSQLRRDYDREMAMMAERNNHDSNCKDKSDK